VPSETRAQSAIGFRLSATSKKAVSLVLEEYEKVEGLKSES
jgi:hypothetical protein